MSPVTVDNRCVDTGANPALSDRFAQTIAAFMVHRHTEACRHQPSRGATHCRFAHTQAPIASTSTCPAPLMSSLATDSLQTFGVPQ